MPEKVILGMSGGVDSSVAGLLLKQAGYEVIGVMLRTWRAGQGDNSFTPQEQSAVDTAQKMAHILNISFRLVDIRDHFRNEVVGYFAEAYSHGLTPNPCVQCNRHVKWKTLIQEADRSGARWIATGHYARRIEMTGVVELRCARDEGKDQSYFLSQLTLADLRRTLFPNGEYLKSEIKAIANDNGLTVVDRQESQDLCFLEGHDYRNILTFFGLEPFQPGPIININGQQLGVHNGLANYTIGQRKGLGVYSERPLYVIKKDIVGNTLFVGDENQLGSDRFRVDKVNWISGNAPQPSIRVRVKIRSRAKWVGAELRHESENSCEVFLNKKLRDITPGQFAVFYNQDIVLGGGVITHFIV